MTVEEYLAWSESQEGRYELIDGVVYAQASERAAHAEMKGLVFLALSNALKDKGRECRALVDGMGVRVGAKTVFEPDAMVYCGPRLPPDALLVENPVIVVEVHIADIRAQRQHPQARRLFRFAEHPALSRHRPGRQARCAS
ncbi:Uma2 family endonuclease [Methylocystis sp. Sn-Cys]|uniref:Uma2 family endonuclease n=1 Tax=Methylocystis sp. Sn-Cys TaxID=1701263 RepID=UPI001FEFBCA4|nr:Uma2 family endonuclease [Methylocystis sp. Sn-Cys]